MKDKKIQSEIKRSSIKIARLVVLLGVKEGYLLVRNLLGVVEHPYLTFGRILKEKDLSQGILIFGIPAGLWFAWVFILLFSRLFVFGRLQFGFWAKASFLASTLLIAFTFLLLGYFIFQVWKKERRKE